MKDLPYVKEITHTGLTDDQARIYTTLLSRGELTASKLAVFTDFSRPLTYKLLDDLIAYSVVTKVDPEEGVATFKAEHPFVLRELIDTKRREVETSKHALEGVMGDMISAYTALSGKPGVRILAGTDGIAELYEDILNENCDISLIRSPKDAEHPELETLVKKQIRAQVKQKIRTRAITPFVDETKDELEKWDTEHLITRKLAWVEHLNPPAQIILFGKKTAITAYDGQLMTTIIENEAIHATFTMMFEFMWNTLQKEDMEIRTGVLNGTLTPPYPKKGP